MPVLALGGETVGGDAILLAMQTAATNVSGGSIPKSGHWVMSEQPAELTRRMLEFLESK
jgi:pimeloyl-ACP methyl ester carboxylesterase